MITETIPKNLVDEMYGQYQIREELLDNLHDQGQISEEARDNALEKMEFAYQDVAHAQTHACEDADGLLLTLVEAFRFVDEFVGAILKSYSFIMGLTK